ncbi:TPA: N-acetylmuramoyl-L-alanine amidase [Streptococcus suis]
MSNTFIELITPLYIKAANECGTTIDPVVLIAQAAHESSHGMTDLAKHANNIAGLKYSAPFNGEKYYKYSPEEQKDGTWKDEKSAFCKFKSIEECVNYHANFCQNTEYRKQYYQKVLNAKSIEDQCHALSGTYATDTKYGGKLLDIIREYQLVDYVAKYKKLLEVQNESLVTSTKPKIDSENDQAIYGFDQKTENRKENNDMREFKQYITQVNMGGQIGKVEYLVLHFVGAAGQALANAKFFYSVDRKSSAHLFIDPKETYQVVPFDRVAWHVGDGRGRYGITNQNSIGVELCQDVTTGKDVWNWDFNPKTRQEAILVFAYLMKKFNVPIERVVRHYDASRKSCPGNWMANDWAKWKLWKKDLETYVKTGKLVNSQKGEVAPVTKPVVEIPKYTSPDKQFTKLEVGQEVTIRQGQTFWYDPNNPQKGIVPSKNFGGKKDKIKKVLDVSAGYSKRAYLLEGLVSWILEQDLVEARAGWDAKVVEKETTIQDDYTLVIDGKKYKVVEDK